MRIQKVGSVLAAIGARPLPLPWLGPLPEGPSEMELLSATYVAAKEFSMSAEEAVELYRFAARQHQLFYWDEESGQFYHRHCVGGKSGGYILKRGLNPYCSYCGPILSIIPPQKALRACRVYLARHWRSRSAYLLG